MIGLLIGLAIDAAALMGIVAIVNQGEQVDFSKAILVALGLAIACGVVGAALPASGFATLLLGLIPIGAVAGLVIWLTLGMTMQRSMIAGALFLVYKIAFVFVLALAFSTS